MRAQPATSERAKADGGETSQTSPLRKVYWTAAAALAALVPMILGAGLWVRSELNQSKRDLQGFLVSRSGELSQRIDADVRQEITVLQAIAALPNLDEPNLPVFHDEAARMIAAMPEWAFVAVARPGGEQVINTLRPVGDRLPSFDPDMMRRAAETRRPVVYTRMGAGDGAVYSGHVVLLCVPVIRNDAIAFILVAGMKAEHVQQLLGQQGQDERITDLIIDERGRILARSRFPERFIGRDAGEAFHQRAAGRPFGLFSAETLDGQEVVTTFQRSPLTGWMSVIAAEGAQFDQLSTRSRWATVATGVLSLMLALILAAFIFYNVIEQRVSKARIDASRALGELDTRLLATTQQALAEQRKAASEREILLREIYHRVKNNLQIIQSLLRLGSRDLSDEQREPFENAVRRIGAMARVHTLLYNSPDLSSIDFRDYLQGLVGEIAEAFGAEERGIATTLDAEPMRVPLDTAVPLAFVATEILTNAYKHAFPENRTGTIIIRAAREEGHGVLEIADNGVGLPAGGNVRRPLGLTIVSKLVQQIGGTLDEPGPGEARFRVVFPLDGAVGAAAPAVEKAPTMAA